MAKEQELPTKIVPPKNCIRFFEDLLFYDKAFLAISTVTILEATIKHLGTLEA